MFCNARWMFCRTRELSIFFKWFIWSRQCCCHCDWWYERIVSNRISKDDILFKKEERFYTISIRKWVSECVIRMNRKEEVLFLSASLVPVITFGENEHYRRYKNWISNRWIWGRSIGGCLPLRHSVMTVGKIKLSFPWNSMEKNSFFSISW